MNDFWLNKLIANSENLLLLLLVMVIIFHLLFVWPRNLSKKQWKRIDYIWLLVAALGIISLSANIRIMVADNWYTIEKNRAIFKYEWIQKIVTDFHPGWLCRTFIRTAYSPNNLDEIQQEHNTACQWNKEINKIISSEEASSLPDITFERIPSLNVTDHILLEAKQDVETAINDYAKQRQVYMLTQHDKSRTELENTLQYLSPILLCFAIALRIAKVSGEIRHEA